MYRDIGLRARAAGSHDTASNPATQPHNTAHQSERGRSVSQGAPATRSGQAYYTAQCVHRLGQGWVHCALDSVLTQCIVLSHCLGHCS